MKTPRQITKFSLLYNRERQDFSIDVWRMNRQTKYPDPLFLGLMPLDKFRDFVKQAQQELDRIDGKLTLMEQFGLLKEDYGKQ